MNGYGEASVFAAETTPEVDAPWPVREDLFSAPESGSQWPVGESAYESGFESAIPESAQEAGFASGLESPNESAYESGSYESTAYEESPYESRSYESSGFEDAAYEDTYEDMGFEDAAEADGWESAAVESAFETTGLEQAWTYGEGESAAPESAATECPSCGRAQEHATPFAESESESEAESPTPARTGPAAAPPAPAAARAARTPDVPLGTLAVRTPVRTWSYRFTPEDLVWAAKLLVYEAGGGDNPNNAAVLWAMFNRYAMFTYDTFGSFGAFVRSYSTTLQPVLHNPQAAARHMHRPPSEFVRTGGTYPGTNIPRGQLRQHLDIQKAPWSSVKQSARELATRALTGELSNPGIGLASEFASTKIYFRKQYGRNPNVEEWRRYTADLAARKRWRWIGDVAGLDQMENAFLSICVRSTSRSTRSACYRPPRQARRCGSPASGNWNTRPRSRPRRHSAAGPNWRR